MQDLSFHIPFSAVGEVDAANCIIRGVSLMEGNLTAEGHDLEVDDTTLSQVLELAKKKGKIPVKLNHGSGIENLDGYIDGKTCWMDSSGERPKIRGDWHLLKTHEETPKILELAQKQPETFGMSAAFKGEGEKLKTGKKAARCHELKAVDCVTDPAANKGGLFSASAGAVDTRRAGMDPANSNHDQTLTIEQQLAALVQGFNDFKTAISERLDAIEAANAPEPTLEEIAALSDEDLAQIGLTRADVEAAVAQAQAEMEGHAGGEGEGEGEGAAAGAGAGAGAGAANFSAQVKKEVMVQFAALKEQEANRVAVEQAEQAFGVIEAKVTELDAKVAEQTKLLAAKDDEIKQLKLAAKTGARPVGASRDIDFSAGAKPKEGTYEFVVKEKYDALIAAGRTPVQARSAAYEFATKTRPDLHTEWRAKGAQEIRLGA